MGNRKTNIEQVLHKLLGQYENSNASKGGGQPPKNGVKISLIFPKYMLSSGLEEKFSQNMALEVLVNEQLISVISDQEEQITHVKLVLANIDAAYQKIGRLNIREQEQALITFLEGTSSSTEAVRLFKQELLEKLRSYKSVVSLIGTRSRANIEEIFRVLEELDILEFEESKRVFSLRVLGDSKRFEQLEAKICAALRLRGGDEAALSNDELLSQFNIVKHPGFVYLKGELNFWVNQQEINLVKVAQEIGICSRSIPQITIPSQRIKRVITVENLTSFFAFNAPSTLVVYLGGYHNTIRRSLLLKLYKAIPEAEYYHFGDIDAGGFQIFEHLCAKTKIPFRPLWMDKATLIKYASYTKPLTTNDQIRLEKLKSNQLFNQVITHMLKHNIKLEQEIVEGDDFF
ncbi:MAG: Wadjet anti-phage system protein JetD domain-containing protein [Culicoidibacterales bacterium]